MGEYERLSRFFGRLAGAARGPVLGEVSSLSADLAELNRRAADLERERDALRAAIEEQRRRGVRALGLMAGHSTSYGKGYSDGFAAGERHGWQECRIRLGGPGGSRAPELPEIMRGEV